MSIRTARRQEVVKNGCVPGVSCATGPQRCRYCTRRADCTGPFPFAAGWLVTLSGSLVDELLATKLFAEEEARVRALRRGWGAVLLEDVWLGSLMHRAPRRKV